MDDFNNNTPSGNEQQNTPESTGNFQSAPEAGNDAQRANSGSPYNGGYQPNNGYPYSNGGGNTQTAHTVRARHTAEITAMSITEIQANRRKNRLTISRQSIKKAAL